MADSDTPNSRRLSSVVRAFDIIEYLWESGPTTLSGVAEHFEMPMSTAHIHLSTLVDSEYVVKDDGEYRCSLRFLHKGGLLRDQMMLFQAAKSEVDDLQQSLGEHANLSVPENEFMVQLYKSESRESIDDNSPLGAHLHLHSTAMGKAMLSRMSEDELNDVLEKRGLPELTGDTITSREALLEELREIREQGYSVNRGEHFAGVCAVAVPILLNETDVIGAISVSGPRSRIKTARIEEEIVPELFDKKNIIELKIKQF